MDMIIRPESLDFRGRTLSFCWVAGSDGGRVFLGSSGYSNGECSRGSKRLVATLNGAPGRLKDARGPNDQTEDKLRIWR